MSDLEYSYFATWVMVHQRQHARETAQQPLSDPVKWRMPIVSRQPARYHWCCKQGYFCSASTTVKAAVAGHGYPTGENHPDSQGILCARSSQRRERLCLSAGTCDERWRERERRERERERRGAVAAWSDGIQSRSMVIDGAVHDRGLESDN
ncbi:hypothetical protein VTO42DRAFT_5781 [Malbranchea cinnamomea]